MKVKTSELQGAALDWAVAKSQGRSEIRVFGRTRPTDRGWVEVRFNPEPRAVTARFDPSENWLYGGSIIEREKLTLAHEDPGWVASLSRMTEVAYTTGVAKRFCTVRGPTPLIAAMRCFVASKLGDEVDVPDALLVDQQ